MDKVPEMPWNCPELFGWSIVGMNHYNQDGLSHLFVAMTKGGVCIKAEGINEKDVFAQLKKATTKTYSPPTRQDLGTRRGKNS